MFHGWEGFYYMVGGAAGGLIGLLFVVMTLTANFDRTQALNGARIFMTPTVVHFTVVLTISALTLAPRLPLDAFVAILAVTVAIGLRNGLVASVALARPKPGSPPAHWSDFWFYGAAPTLIYLVLGAGGAALWVGASCGVYIIAAMLLGLLLSGIRNAWDLVTWMAPRGSGEGNG